MFADIGFQEPALAASVWLVPQWLITSRSENEHLQQRRAQKWGQKTPNAFSQGKHAYQGTTKGISCLLKLLKWTWLGPKQFTGPWALTGPGSTDKAVG